MRRKGWEKSVCLGVWPTFGLEDGTPVWPAILLYIQRSISRLPLDLYKFMSVLYFGLRRIQIIAFLSTVSCCIRKRCCCIPLDNETKHSIRIHEAILFFCIIAFSPQIAPWASRVARKFDLFSLHWCRSHFPRLWEIHCELGAMGDSVGTNRRLVPPFVQDIDSHWIWRQKISLKLFAILSKKITSHKSYSFFAIQSTSVETNFVNGLYDKKHNIEVILYFSPLLDKICPLKHMMKVYIWFGKFQQFEQINDSKTNLTLRRTEDSNSRSRFISAASLLLFKNPMLTVWLLGLIWTASLPCQT